MASSEAARAPGVSRVHTASYCLYCYAPLETTRAVSQLCPRCGRRFTRADHAQYWSREPRLRSIEALVKTCIVLAMVALFFVILGELLPVAGEVITFFIGPLVWFGGVLYWTAGLITRRPRYFSPKLLWVGTIVLYVVGTPLLMFVLDVVARRESFGREYWEKFLVLMSPAVPLLMIATALRLFGERFEEFKRRRIEGGAASAGR